MLDKVSSGFVAPKSQQPFRALVASRKGPVSFIALDGRKLTVIVPRGVLLPIAGQRLTSKRKTVQLFY